MPSVWSDFFTYAETKTHGARGDEGRQGVVDPGEQAGIVGESGSQRTADGEGTANLTEAERKSLRKRKLNRQVERFDEVTAYKNASEVFGSEKYEGDIAEIPEELYTEEMKEAAEKLAKDGIRVRYFKGTLMSETHDGRMRRTPGLFRAGTNEVWASVSSARFSPEQIAMHEYYHALVYRGVANVEQTVQEIKEKFSPEEFEQIVEQYISDYRGAYEGDKIEDIYEEILADAYAGMNRFAKEKSAVQYQDVVRDQIQRGTNENERATRDTRGVPETKYSIAESLKDDLEAVYNNTFDSKSGEVRIGETSDFLVKEIGAKALPNYMPANKAYSAMATEEKAVRDGKPIGDNYNYHGLGVQGLYELLEMAETPVAAYADDPSDTDGRFDRIVLVTDKEINGNLGVVVVEVESKSLSGRKRIKTNKTITAYDKQTAIGAVRRAFIENRLLYIDKKSGTMFDSGVKDANCPTAMSETARKNNIQHFWENVNWEKYAKDNKVCVK